MRNNLAAAAEERLHNHTGAETVLVLTKTASSEQVFVVSSTSCCSACLQ